MTNRLARAAVRRLRAGVVPDWEIRSLTVGATEFMRRVDEVIGSMKQAGPSPPLFVRGEWGTGKTHILAMIRALSATQGIASCRVDLNARDTPLNRPQYFYARLMQSLRVNAIIGLRPVLTRILSEAPGRDRVRRFAASGEAGDLRFALTYLSTLDATNGDDHDLADHYWAYLLGADLLSSTQSASSAQALDRLQAVASLFAWLGVGGLVVLLDEVETIDQLWSIASRRVAYRVLWQLCRSRRMWPVFGVTDRFERTITVDRLRRSDALGVPGDGARSFATHWAEGSYSVVAPPTIDADGAMQLANALVALYERAHGPRVEVASEIERLGAMWSTSLRRNPRQLIRELIHALDCGRTTFGLAAPSAPSGLPDPDMDTPIAERLETTEAVAGCFAAPQPLAHAPSAPSPADPVTYLRALGFEVVDLRDRGGCLWVVDAPPVAKAVSTVTKHTGLEFHHAKKSRACGSRPAWWALG